jgi:hypothetical protein
MLSASCPCFDLCLVRTVDSGLVDDGLGVIQAMPFETGERRLGPWAAYGARCSVVAGCTHDDMELAGCAAEQLLLLDPGNADRYDALAQMFDGSGR